MYFFSTTICVTGSSTKVFFRFLEAQPPTRRGDSHASSQKLSSREMRMTVTGSQCIGRMSELCFFQFDPRLSYVRDVTASDEGGAAVLLRTLHDM